MGTYEDQFNASKKEGQAASLNVRIQQWTKPGLKVIGKLIRVAPLAKSAYDVEVQTYLFQTDEGLVSCVLGAAMDKEVGDRLVVGNLYYVEYQGKRDIGQGRKVNLFDVRGFVAHDVPDTGPGAEVLDPDVDKGLADLQGKDVAGKPQPAGQDGKELSVDDKIPF